MSSSRPFAERVRAASLIEVMVSQAIAVTLIAGLSSLVVAMVKKMHAETAVSDSQGRLRQASHLLLRDLQGIGGGSLASATSTGGFVRVVDGGANAPDELEVFRRDESICGGSLTVAMASGTNVTANTTGVATGGCPFFPTNTICVESDFETRQVVVIGASSPFRANMVAANAHSNEAQCLINFPAGSQPSGSPSISSLAPTNILFGTSFYYKIDSTDSQHPKLVRRIGSGPFTVVADDVYDLQVERIYDFANPGVIDQTSPTDATDEVVTATCSDSSCALPTGAADSNFTGINVGLVAFARAADGREQPPPSTFSNRTHSSAPTGRRYRASVVFASARNSTNK